MFFSERITSIRPTDRVLEVGPGGTPHDRADVFLEKEFECEQVARGQRGYAAPLSTDRPIVYYDGGAFPFRDGEFDYVICSHVVEHVSDVDAFISELCRVAPRGYLEFPTIYYEYLYDFPEHSNCLLFRDDLLWWMPKQETCLAAFRSITDVFYESLHAGHTSLINGLKPLMFQGFEWDRRIETKRTRELQRVCFDAGLVAMPSAEPSKKMWPRRLRFWKRAA